MSSSKYNTKLLERAIEFRPLNHQGDPRRMGIEVEFAGLESKQIIAPIENLLGGSVEWQSPFDIDVIDTKLGKFKVELDSNSVKKVGEESSIKGDIAAAEPGFERTYIETVSSVASAVVPWEVVSPPIPFASLPMLFPLIEQYRELGAKGTRDQIHYAFGVHLNPELDSLDASTIVNHLKSFFCVYEWIKFTENTDTARRITPYINHFPSDYIKLVLAADYRPSLSELITDYLQHNPTRNRSLDMLPLFAFLNEEMVQAKVDDDRVNARPTFHYRLANCDIDNPEWNLDQSIENWMVVEHLAYANDLQQICDEFSKEMDKLMPVSGAKWSARIDQRIAQFDTPR